MVRNGYRQPRKVTTAAGGVEVKAPRVNDKRVDAETGERKRFSSAILPLCCHGSPKISEVLPLLYLHGLSSGDFVPALEQSFGSTAGLSPATVTRLTTPRTATTRSRRSRRSPSSTARGSPRPSRKSPTTRPSHWHSSTFSPSTGSTCGPQLRSSRLSPRSGYGPGHPQGRLPHCSSGDGLQAGGARPGPSAGRERTPPRRPCPGRCPLRRRPARSAPHHRGSMTDFSPAPADMRSRHTPSTPGSTASARRPCPPASC